MLRGILPYDLQKYFEYIPDDRLQDVFVDLIRDAVKRRIGSTGSAVSEPNEISSAVMQFLQSNSPNIVKAQGIGINEDVKQEKELEPEVRTIDVLDTGDLGDLMDLMK